MCNRQSARLLPRQTGFNQQRRLRALVACECQGWICLYGRLGTVGAHQLVVQDGLHQHLDLRQIRGGATRGAGPDASRDSLLILGVVGAVAVAALAACAASPRLRTESARLAAPLASSANSLCLRLQLVAMQGKLYVSRKRRARGETECPAEREVLVKDEA